MNSPSIATQGFIWCGDGFMQAPAKKFEPARSPATVKAQRWGLTNLFKSKTGFVTSAVVAGYALANSGIGNKVASLFAATKTEVLMPKLGALMGVSADAASFLSAGALMLGATLIGGVMAIRAKQGALTPIRAPQKHSFG